MWEKFKYYAKWSVGVMALLVLLVVGLKSFVTVPVGHTGVVMRFNAAQPGGIQPGLHWITPFVTTVFNYNTQLQKSTFKVAGASVDSQEINALVTLNWTPDSTKVGELLDHVGTNDSIIMKILNPAVQGAFKEATAKFKANEILPKRSELKSLVVADLKLRLERHWVDKLDKQGNAVIDEKTKKALKKSLGHDIFLNAVSVENLSFSKKYTNSIEEVAEAEQKAKKAGYQEQEKKAIARGTVAEAEGLAKAQRLQANTITPNYLKLRQLEVTEKAISAWEKGGSQVPKFSGGGNVVPFMNASDMIK